MKLLAIDTSTDYLSLAVISGGKVLARVHRKTPRSHSSLLMPMIDRVLKRSKTVLRDIDGFCLSIGPGSFTGLRIGTAAVKGLALATKKPIVAVPTLDVIAENGKKFCGIICPVLDARKGKVYASIYRSDGERVKKVSRHLLVSVDDLLGRLEKYKKILFLGDFAEKIVERLPNTGSVLRSWRPRSEVVGLLGAERFRDRKFVKPENLEPMYLYSRECDITGK